MKETNLIVMLLISCASLSLVSPAVSLDNLSDTDFKQESWAKSVDYFEYAREFASHFGVDTPPGFQNYHANLFMTYINTSGLHLIYAGLENVTFGGPAYFRIPMQSFIMHYKTNSSARDVLLASTFLMLLAFNETGDSIHSNSPDMNDTLWASFSMGFDLSQLGATLPVLNSKTETIPLTHSDDKLHWSWGMKYTNLTAFWFETWINPADPHYGQNWPAAITVYDELAFTYDLTINPTTKTATFTENHVIGRMRDLLIWRLIWVHYNSTGTYSILGSVPGYTVYDFIDDNKIKMSIVNFQTSILADRETYCLTPNDQNVTDTDTPISDTSIATYTDDGEKICNADFGTKKTYRLYNYTADPTESIYSTHNATSRTAKTAGFARQTGLFQYHIGLMKFLPLTVAHVYPGLFEKARDTITNMSRANYFYLIGYPDYSGYRVEHDPTFTVYLMTSAPETPPSLPNWGGIVVIGAIIAAVVISGFLVMRRRASRATQLNVSKATSQS